MTVKEVLSQFSYLDSAEISAIEHAGFRDGEIEPFSVVDYFIKKGNIATVAKCLDNGFNPNSSESGDFGSSLLHIAIRFDQMEIFKLLLEKDADKNFVDKVGWTPLMESVVDDKPVFGKALIDAGARKDFVNHRGATARALASKFGRQDFLRFL